MCFYSKILLLKNQIVYIFESIRLLWDSMFKTTVKSDYCMIFTKFTVNINAWDSLGLDKVFSFYFSPILYKVDEKNISSQNRFSERSISQCPEVFLFVCMCRIHTHKHTHTHTQTHTHILLEFVISNFT